LLAPHLKPNRLDNNGLRAAEAEVGIYDQSFFCRTGPTLSTGIEVQFVACSRVIRGGNFERRR
jgi:hypothetical protein